MGGIYLIQLHTWHYGLQNIVQSPMPSTGLKIQINTHSLTASIYNPFLPANQ
ncbi:hypothetical protein D3C81_952680 [compost metagenome]|nr:hypothetical protein [Sphingobacterium sp. BIGb0116]